MRQVYWQSPVHDRHEGLRIAQRRLLLYNCVLALIGPISVAQYPGNALVHRKLFVSYIGKGQIKASCPTTSSLNRWMPKRAPGLSAAILSRPPLQTVPQFDGGTAFLASRGAEPATAAEIEVSSMWLCLPRCCETGGDARGVVCHFSRAARRFQIPARKF